MVVILLPEIVEKEICLLLFLLEKLASHNAEFTDLSFLFVFVQIIKLKPLSSHTVFAVNLIYIQRLLSMCHICIILPTKYIPTARRCHFACCKFYKNLKKHSKGKETFYLGDIICALIYVNELH